MCSHRYFCCEFAKYFGVSLIALCFGLAIGEQGIVSYNCNHNAIKFKLHFSSLKMPPKANFTADELRRMKSYHARPPGEGSSNWISPEEISARAAAAAAKNTSSHTASSCTSSSSSDASTLPNVPHFQPSSAHPLSNERSNLHLQPDADAVGENLGRGKRKKRPINRFTPEARKAKSVGTSSSSSSSSSSSCSSSSPVTPAPKKRSVEVERRLELSNTKAQCNKGKPKIFMANSQQK